MTSTEGETSAGTDAMRLRACPNCDYSLYTLPAEGICPECGRPYDTKYLVLTGRGRGQFDTPLAGTWRSFASLALVGLMIYSFFSPSLRWNLLPSFWWLIPLPFMFVITMFVRLISPAKPMMQLWVCDEGVAQIPSTSEARVAQFVMQNLWVLILLVAVGLGVLVDRPSLQTALIIGAIALAITAVMLVMVVRRYRREIRATTPIEKGGAPRLALWRDITNVDMQPLKGNRARIRVHQLLRWRSISVKSATPVDIEINCDSHDFGTLRNRLIALRWCRASPHQASSPV